MNLTEKMLIDKKSCIYGIKRYKKAGSPDTIETAVLLCLEKSRFIDANWLLTRIAFSKHQCFAYGINALEIMMLDFEQKIPGNYCIRNCINACKFFMAGAICYKELQDASDAVLYSKRYMLNHNSIEFYIKNRHPIFYPDRIIRIVMNPVILMAEELMASYNVDNCKYKEFIYKQLDTILYSLTHYYIPGAKEKIINYGLTLIKE